MKLKITLCTAMTLLSWGARADDSRRELDLHQLAALPDDEDHADYYRLLKDERGIFVRADYRPGMKAMKRGLALRDLEKAGHHILSWRWRARLLPNGGDECDEDKGDSAGSVYIGWRRGLRWYGLKYSFSSAGRKGKVCDRKRNPFVASDTIILESGGPLDIWIEERVDLEAEFRRHFEDGDPTAEVPDLIGIAILTDGDQTESPASADFGSFVLRSAP